MDSTKHRNESPALKHFNTFVGAQTLFGKAVQPDVSMGKESKQISKNGDP